MRISKMSLVALATFSASCSGSSPHPVGHVGSSSPSTAPKISAAPSASPETPLTRAAALAATSAINLRPGDLVGYKAAPHDRTSSKEGDAMFSRCTGGPGPSAVLVDEYSPDFKIGSGPGAVLRPYDASSTRRRPAGSGGGRTPLATEVPD